MDILRDIARPAADVAVGVVKGLNPVAGVVLGWAVSVAFEIIDDVRRASDPVAAAQHASDRLVDLVEDLKLGPGK